MNEIIHYLFHHSPVVSYICKASGDFGAIFITDNIEKQLGYSPSQFLDESSFWVNNIHPEDQARVLDNLPEIFQSGKHVHEYRFRAANGEYRWMRDELRLIYDDNGQPQNIAGFWIDISERKETEIALQHSYDDLEKRVQQRTLELEQTLEHLNSAISSLEDSEQTLRTLFEASHDAMILIDNDGFVDCNPAALAQFACNSRQEFLKLSPVNLSPTTQPNGLASKELAQEYIQKAMQEGGHRFEWDAQRLDGTRFICEVQLSKVELKEKQLLLAICRDVSARKESEKEREFLSKQLQNVHRMDAIGRLTGGIAHDFNNILATIIGFSNLAKRITGVTPGLEKLDDYISEVTTAGNRAKELVSQLLTFSRGDKPPLTTFNPVDIIHETIKMLRSTIQASIEMETFVNVVNPSIFANPVQLQQVLVNLVINARDALNNGTGKIQVTLSLATNKCRYCISCFQQFEGQYLKISVVDNGCGIASNKLTQIFEPFYTTKEFGGGTGLGLPVVHGIVHQCNGHISASSMINAGTKISAYFPITNGDQLSSQKAVVAEPIKEIPQTKPARLMAIDDERSITIFLKELLESNNYIVDSFLDPIEALNQFNSNPGSYDLIITDQTMPHMSGVELIEKILSVNKNIPIILCTGYSSVLNEELANKKGAKAFLTKPVDNDKLLSIIKALLD